MQVEYFSADSKWHSEYVISAVDEFGVTLSKEGVENIFFSRRTFLVNEALLWRRSQSALSNSEQAKGLAVTGEHSIQETRASNCKCFHPTNEEEGGGFFQDGRDIGAVSPGGGDEGERLQAVGASCQGGTLEDGEFLFEAGGTRRSPPPHAPSIRRRFQSLFLGESSIGDFTYLSQPGGYYLSPETSNATTIAEVEDEAGRIQIQGNGTYHFPCFIRLPNGRNLSDIFFWRRTTQQPFKAYIKIGEDADDENMLKAIPYPVNVPVRAFHDRENEKILPAQSTVPRPDFQNGTNVICFLSENEIFFAKVAHTIAKFNRLLNGRFERFEYNVNAVEVKNRIGSFLVDQLYRIYQGGEVLLHRTGTQTYLVVVKTVNLWTIECDVLENISIFSEEPFTPTFTWSTRNIFVNEDLFSVRS